MCCSLWLEPITPFGGGCHATVTLPLHYRYVAVALPLHYRHITPAAMSPHGMWAVTLCNMQARFMRAQRAYETITDARKPAAAGPSVTDMHRGPSRSPSRPAGQGGRRGDSARGTRK